MREEKPHTCPRCGSYMIRTYRADRDGTWRWMWLCILCRRREIEND